MVDRDQDLQRIQEIRQLLESRQRFFGGLQIADSYKINSRGEPVPRSPTSQPSKMFENPSEPSLGHSVEANFGSSSASGSNIYQMNQKFIVSRGSGTFGDGDEGDSSNESEIMQDRDDDVASSFGHYCADQSHNDSSSVSSLDEDGRGTMTRPRKKKTVKLRRRRPKGENNSGQTVGHTEIPSPSTLIAKPSKSSLSPANSSSPIFRKKSVTFDKNLLDSYASTGIVAKKGGKKSQVDPIVLLKKQSYMLKAEAAKKLDGTALSSLVKLDPRGLLGVTNGSLTTAREKLKNAEKSLRVTVKSTENAPIKSIHYSLEFRRQASQPQPVKLPGRNISRLAIRQAEEALRSDMNLREAFALIKINPDPILDLAPPDIFRDKSSRQRRSTAYMPEEKGANYFHIGHGMGMSPAYEDAETTKSLRRLTQLSFQHQKKQKSLIPEPFNAPVGMQGMKGQGQGKKLKDPVEVKWGSVSVPSVSSRRKSSTSSTGNQLKHLRKRSKDGGPKLAFSRLEAALRAERRGLSDLDGGIPRQGYHTVDKLSGTIL